MVLHGGVLHCPDGVSRCFLPDMNETLGLCVLYDLDSFNFSLTEVSRLLHEHQTHDHNIDPVTEAVLIVVYTLLIVFGLLANLVVSVAVGRKTHTPRNLYIVNLSASDMTLCTVCMPFTLAAIIRRHWALGQTLCKLLPALQGANILVSVGTIAVIALDRYISIVRGQEGRNSKRRVVTSIISLWLTAALATSPLFYFQVLVPVRFHRLVLYEMCLEQWPSQDLKVTYTVAVLLLQAVVPALVVGVVHTRIAAHLRRHARGQRDMRRVHRQLQRNRRTTLLLTLMSILFVLSWLPLSVFSLTADVLYPPDTLHGQVSPQRLYVAFAVCHVIAMSSAVSNPVVYGWLNSNIRRELLQILQSQCGAPVEQFKETPLRMTRAAVKTVSDTERKGHSVAHEMRSFHSKGFKLSRVIPVRLETVV